MLWSQFCFKTLYCTSQDFIEFIVQSRDAVRNLACLRSLCRFSISASRCVWTSMLTQAISKQSGTEIRIREAWRVRTVSKLAPKGTPMSSRAAMGSVPSACAISMCSARARTRMVPTRQSFRSDTAALLDGETVHINGDGRPAAISATWPTPSRRTCWPPRPPVKRLQTRSTTS